MSGQIYVANQGSNNVSIIDLSSGLPLATVLVGAAPKGLKVSPDGSRILVANSSGSSVSVIDTMTRSVIATVPVGLQPVNIEFNLLGTKAYVGNFGNGSITPNFGNGTISVISLATNTVTNTIQTGPATYALRRNNAGNRLFVAAGSPLGRVYVIDTVSETVLTSISAGYGTDGVTVSQDDSQIYVITDGNYPATAIPSTLMVLNTATNALLSTLTLPIGAQDIEIKRDGTALYIASYGTSSTAGMLSVVALPSNVITHSVPLGFGPSALTLSADGSRAYVANFTSSTISVLDTVTDTVINTISTGANPYGLAVFSGAVVSVVPGCTNPAAINYNPAATINNGTCILPIRGCTNPLATNYNRLANTDDGSCILPVRGCKDPTATNYNPAATIDDGSCVFPLVLSPHICPVILTPAIPVGSWEVGQRTLPFLSDYPATSLPTLFARNEVFPTHTRLIRLDAAEEGGDPSLPAWMDGSGKQSGLTYSLLRSFYDMLTGARLRLPFERLEQCCGLSDLSTNGLAPRRAFVLDAADPGLNALSWDSGDAGTNAAMGTVIRRAQSLWDLLTAFDPVFLPTGTGALVLRNLDPLVSTGACPDEAIVVIDVTLESLSDSALIPAALCSRKIPSGLDLSDGTLSAGGTVALFLQ